MTDGKFLSLGVRTSRHQDAPEYEDRIDSTDDTTRFEVLAVTNTGYKMSDECIAMIDTISTKDPSGANWSNAISGCLESFPPSSTGTMVEDTRPTLNQTLIGCWQGTPGGIFSNIVKDCEALYTGGRSGNFNPSRAYHPSELRPAAGGPYLCYGLYDSSIDHLNRIGYGGRCWIPGGGEGVTQYNVCNPRLPAATGECDLSAHSPCYWRSGADQGNQDYLTHSNRTAAFWKNTADEVYRCKTLQQEGTGSSSRYYCTQWQKMGTWSEDSVDCDYPSDSIAIGESETGGAWETTPAIEDGNCFYEAWLDYCSDTTVVEVIDPSDATGKTAEKAGILGLIKDAELIAQLGGADPIATMKGYIQQSSRPEGIIHDVAKDLRLGMMAIHYVGAATECAMTSDSKLEKYCPQNNKDGAQLFTPLELGSLVLAEDSSYQSDKRRHVDELAESINTVRATSWTPLGEALYSALGYYTQNLDLCLNKDDDGKCLDWCTEKDPEGNCLNYNDNDPVQYWCQGNHILLITEGESTADYNSTVKALAENVASATEDLEAPKLCSEDLYGSTYLTAMTWLGQNVNVHPTYYEVPDFTDPDGNVTQKQNIFTHVVTTGTLANIGTGECNPKTLMENAAKNGGTGTYYPGENPQQLEDNLRAALDDIMSRSSAGSAASVISSSRSGSGAVYQAVFWPEYKGEEGTKVSWVGDVHSLFVSSDGLMHEDTDQDGKLNPKSDGGLDRQVVLYFSDAVKKTRGCYDIQGFYDPERFKANGNKFICPDDPIDSCNNTHSCVELQDIAYIWSVKNHLSERSKSTTSDIVTDRKIFTWNDLNNDGIVDADEWFQLNTLRETNLTPEHLKEGSTLSKLNKKTEGKNRGPVGTDFLPQSAWNDLLGYAPEPTGLTAEESAAWKRQREQEAMNVLVEWLQGKEEINEHVRSRSVKVKVPSEIEGVDAYDTIHWLLGDIIHSTPIVVARPAEAYHYIYRDPTYAQFAAHWANRRHMVYFGGNDGMLHAVNGGFYFENKTQFCCTKELNSDGTGTCDSPPVDGACSGTYDLGEEVWAYIPYNLQPHLKCLTDKHYNHKYYVDQKPRIFDVQIFEEDEDHVGGWGTILVGSMRFGGAPIKARDLNGDDDDNDKRIFTSAFFILDITNPEKDPTLLAEMTLTSEEDVDGNKVYTNLNYTTSSPSMVIMRDGGNHAVESRWYLVMGNGPTDQDGRNNPGTQGTLAILPLDWLDGKITSWTSGVPKAIDGTKRAFRIPNQEPSTLLNEGGRFLVPLAKENSASFISDIISVDYNIDMTATDDLGVRYRTDAVYFGTTDGTDFKKYPAGYLDNLEEQFHWDGGGRLFRMVTKVLDSTSPVAQELASKPSDWADQWQDNTESTKYNKGPIRMLVDLQMPTISAPSIGYDGANYWVYIGTGRFFGEEDKTDDGWNISVSPTTKNTKTGFFGLKEPLMDDSYINPPHWKNPLHTDLKDYRRYPVMTWDRIKWDINNQHNGNLQPDAAPGSRGLMQSDKIFVVRADETALFGNSYLVCSDAEGKACSDATCQAECFPKSPTNVWEKLVEEFNNPDTTSATLKVEVPVFSKLLDYIKGTGFETRIGLDGEGKLYATGLDGWYRDFHDARERNLGAAALLGGLLTYTSYQPFNDPCSPEGESYLYGVHFQTGTAWTESVFGIFEDTVYGSTQNFVKDRLSLGRGLSTTPSMHVGSGEDAAKAFIQTSTGEIIEVSQENLPFGSPTSGRQNWSDRPHQ